MKHIILISLLFIINACGGSDGTHGYFNNSVCNLNLSFSNKTTGYGYDALIYKAKVDNDCHNFFFNTTGEWSYRLDINTKASQGFVNYLSLDKENLEFWEGPENDNSFFMGRTTLQKEIRYLQREDRSWLLPLVPAPTEIYVKMSFPSGIETEFYPNLITFNAELLDK